MRAVRRNNVRVFGRGKRVLLFGHGFGCDQTMWREMTHAFEADYRIVLFDHVGSGRSDTSEFDFERYSSLHGYAQDVIDILEELDLWDIQFVGHAVSGMIGALAAIASPERFASLTMIEPSPCYLNDGGYVGGLDRRTLKRLLAELESNPVVWSATMAPLILGSGVSPFLVAELEACLCRMNPVLAHHFARVMFHSDHRADLPDVPVSTLVLTCRGDIFVPLGVGEYMQRRLPDCRLVMMPGAAGHCPPMSSPKEVIREIRGFLSEDHARLGSASHSIAEEALLITA